MRVLESTFGNTFLATRAIFFFIAAWLNAFTLVFASLNVASTLRRSELPVPGAAEFLVFNSSVTLVMLLIGVAWRLTPRVAQINFECGWTAILSVLHFVATVLMTSNLPATCRLQSNLRDGECISTSILVPVIWLSSCTLIAYFFMLSVTTVIHAPSYPGIWSTTVYAVPWFARYRVPRGKTEPTSLKLTTHQRSTSFTSESDDLQEELDLEAGSSDTHTQSSDISVGPWATDRAGRRGIDPPFATRGQPAEAKHSTPTTNALRLPRATRYFELSWYAKAANALSIFPREVVDQNEPIPKPPSLSEWIRANDMNGVNGHNVSPKLP